MRHIFAFTFAALLAAPAADAITISAYQPAFFGIRTATATVGDSQAYVARINLDAPGISFTGSRREGPIETIAQTTSQFLLSSGTSLAINSGFFAPCCAAANEPKDIIGLTVSDGVVVSPLEPGRTASLLVDSLNNVTIDSVLNVPAGVDDAVTGSNILLADGLNVAPTASTGFNNANPRTAAGVSEDGRFLYLVVIDGRQPGYSIGASLFETAELLGALGAYDAVNLDGGGSSTFVVADGMGGADVVNRPSTIINGVNTERFNGGNFGVFARPFVTPAPAAMALFGLGALAMVARRRG